MFVIATERLPIKVWLDSPDELEQGALEQVKNVANLPFAFKHIALMPDCHAGYGVPIGCVFATKNVIIPNAVGVDIGCGMAFARSNMRSTDVPKETLRKIVDSIMRSIPTGFEHHRSAQPCAALEDVDFIWSESKINKQLEKEIAAGRHQIGTLGGGNHFIEIQRDETDTVCIMVHSGSRNFGYKIANAYNKLAKELNQKWHSQVPPQWGLAFLPTDSAEGQDYLAWMQLALAFAQENRARMMAVIKEVIAVYYPNTSYDLEVNAHHNYAALENHYGEKVWVHRKGAILARKGVKGIIPGSMGSPSYIVEGLGESLSFHSSSHGAGRRMGRKEALQRIPAHQTIEDLQKAGIVLGKRMRKDISEEARWAYKDIDAVIKQQQDLIKPIHRLEAMAVVKG
ncbi:MAG: RtcB family protein [Limnochordia bacterium]